MIALGSTTHRFERTTEPAWKIINSLSVPPLASRRQLQIHLEMVDEHLPLQRTAAGRSVLDTLNDLMSSFKGIFSRRFGRVRKRLSSPTTQHSKSSLRRSSSLRIRTSTFASSDSPAVGYQSVLGQVILCGPPFAQQNWYSIHYLQNAIAPSLSLALFIETTTRTHLALSQVLEAATLLIDVVSDYEKEAKLSADVKTAINAFAKEMNSVQGIIQGAAQRKPGMRRVLELTDVRVIPSCTNSRRLWDGSNDIYAEIVLTFGNPPSNYGNSVYLASGCSDLLGIGSQQYILSHAFVDNVDCFGRIWLVPLTCSENTREISVQKTVHSQDYGILRAKAA
ncbi:hypothetical protein EDD16DRAFT_1704272 [Pisolithus croceorrhizus]|nr:hypothetical protein EDD16DRAFT_1704272 [Pisolithus croceorrhizus]KAI6156079.1 hypothetical protein EDD17DRAFT_1764724 [Pisolithus thermaeus]